MNATATTLYPFIPSGPDYDLAIPFFESVGFTTAWQDGDLAGLRFGGAYFLLQNIDVPECQANQMVTFEVDDLECYWEELSTLDLDAFPEARLKEPTDCPWRREIHLIAPGGVCWPVREAG
jgi:hypothetical protein